MNESSEKGAETNEGEVQPDNQGETSRIARGAEAYFGHMQPNEHDINDRQSRKVTVQFTSFGIPSMAQNMNTPYARIPYSDEQCITRLKEVSDGEITSRTIEVDAASANRIITKLDDARTRARVELAKYIELPLHDIVGLPTDELERKLYARHFRNRDAQHRVFMIGFSVALFCVIGAVVSDVMSEANAGITTIAALVGAATTVLGIAGNISMRMSDARKEKHAICTIQELALFDSVIDRFKAALR